MKHSITHEGIDLDLIGDYCPAGEEFDNDSFELQEVHHKGVDITVLICGRVLDDLEHIALNSSQQ